MITSFPPTLSFFLTPPLNHFALIKILALVFSPHIGANNTMSRSVALLWHLQCAYVHMIFLHTGKTLIKENLTLKNKKPTSKAGEIAST